MNLEYFAVPESLEVLKEDGDTTQEEAETSLKLLSMAKLGIIRASG